jgi:Flp pilus assembly protein TadG
MCRTWTLNPLRARKKSFRKSEEATVTIEFGMIFPVFLMLVVTMIETAGMMFQEYTIQAGIHNAARMIRTGQAQNSSWSAGSFKAEVCKTAKILTGCASNLKIHVDSQNTFIAMKTAAPTFTSVGNDPTTTFRCGDPLKVVVVIATYDHKFIVPFMRYFGNVPSKPNHRRLTGTTMFRNEPFTKLSSCV